MRKGPIGLGLVGVGKIAREHHLPAVYRNSDFMLRATVSTHSSVKNVQGYPDFPAMLAGARKLNAVAICTPPAQRYAIAHAAINARLHVLLEKPPAGTLAEAALLVDHARHRGVTVFATWHARESNNVDIARDWLWWRRVDAVRIEWREDIRAWHSARHWILGEGEFGVLDPGIDALSIITTILPLRLQVDAGKLRIPVNHAAPISASLTLNYGGGVPVTAELDFLHTGPPVHDIVVQTDVGVLTLRDGGRHLSINGLAFPNEEEEYPRMYRRFATLIDRKESDVDLLPLKLVEDALSIGHRIDSMPFDF